MEKLVPSSKLNNHMAFLEYLFDLGRNTADRWLKTNGNALGKHSTIDLQKLLPVETALAAFDHKAPDLA